MAIKGLTDQPAALPQIGILRKGSPRPESGRQPGRDLTYFRFDTKDAIAADKFLNAYGAEPRQINCFLPFETVEEVFLTSKESYGASGLKSRCDGETLSALRLPNGKMQRQFSSPMPCPGSTGSPEGRKFCEDCKNVGRLKLIIPELEQFAYVVAETHGIWDIVHIDQQLKAFQLTFGKLTGIPFVLSRVPEKISTPRGSGGDRVRSEKWLLNIGIHPEWASRQLEAVRTHQLASASLYQIGGAPARSLPSAPMRRSLPAARVNFRQSDAWLEFERDVSIAVTSRNGKQLERVIQDAFAAIDRGELPEAARSAIGDRWDSAVNALGNVGLVEDYEAEYEPDYDESNEPEPEEVSTKDRILAIAALTGHSVAQIGSLRKAANLPTAEKMSESHFVQLRGLMFSDWAVAKNAFSSIEDSAMALSAIANSNPEMSDHELWQTWNKSVEGMMQTATISG